MELPKTALPIKDAIDHWVDIDGSIYCLDGRNNRKKKIIKKAVTYCWGYQYCGIRYPDGTRTKRVHRLVAEAFIPNPYNLPIVGHRNNIKDDNRVENLYWTTFSENTKKAYDDGLAKNDRGYDDSQSKPVSMFDTYTNKLLGNYGSIKEASRDTNIPITTIARQTKYKRPTRKEYYFRFQDDPSCMDGREIIGMFDYDSDKLLEVFVNAGDASRKTGISDRTIAQQCQNDLKPSRKMADVYFLRISNN